MKLIKWIVILYITILFNGCVKPTLPIQCYSFPTVESETIEKIKKLNDKKVDLFFRELLILKKEINIDCKK